MEVIENSRGLVLCSSARLPGENPGEAIGESLPQLQQEVKHFGDDSAKGWSAKNISSHGASKIQSIYTIILILVCDLGNEKERKG